TSPLYKTVCATMVVLMLPPMHSGGPNKFHFTPLIICILNVIYFCEKLLFFSMKGVYLHVLSTSNWLQRSNISDTTGATLYAVPTDAVSTAVICSTSTAKEEAAHVALDYRWHCRTHYLLSNRQCSTLPNKLQYHATSHASTNRQYA